MRSTASYVVLQSRGYDMTLMEHKSGVDKAANAIAHTLPDLHNRVNEIQTLITKAKPGGMSQC